MIPKVVHYLWLSDEKTPEIEQCLASWREKLVGYEIKEWNKSTFPYQDFLWTREAFSMKKWAFVTDFFRLWVLDNYGGVYLDADVTLTGTFDGFLDQSLFIGTEGSCKLGAHVIGAEKGHPYISHCLRYYSNRHFIMEDGSLNIRPMPGIITKVFMSLYKYDGVLVRFDGVPLHFKDLTVYPDTFFTINTYDGNNVCWHNAFGSWRFNSPSERVIREDVIRNYLIKKYLCYSIFRNYNLLKRILFFVMPVGVLSLRYKHSLRIKNNKEVRSVPYDSNSPK